VLVKRSRWVFRCARDTAVSRALAPVVIDIQLHQMVPLAPRMTINISLYSYVPFKKNFCRKLFCSKIFTVQASRKSVPLSGDDEVVGLSESELAETRTRTVHYIK